MIIDYHDNWEIVLVKKKMYKYNLGLKKSGGGKRGGGGGSSGKKDGGGSSGKKDGGGAGGGSSGGDGGCKWLWLLFIVIDILVYCDVYIILLC